jgi:glycosidase
MKLVNISVGTLICLSLISFSKSFDPPFLNAVIKDTISVQYGIPYMNVPAPKDVVMYQVNIHAFSAQHNFAGVAARLDSIHALGVNVLYLLPIYPTGIIKSVNSPYCVKDYTGVNKQFGTLDDLRKLVAAAHKRNMAVIFDWVANHTSFDNAWIKNRSWYQQDSAGNIISPLHTGWSDVAALNYKNDTMRLAMIHAMKYWIYQANIDGYRCDAADFITGDFWHQAIDSLHAIHTHKLLLFAEGTRDDLFPDGFQLKYAMYFYYNLVRNIYGSNSSVLSIDTVNKVEYINAKKDDRVVRYTSNHDVNKTDGTPLDLLKGKKGSLAAFVIAAYMKGVPLIYNGQEVACATKLNFFDDSTTINWNVNPDITAVFKRLLFFHNNSEAVKQGELISYSNNDVCAFTKSYNKEKVLVIVNCRDTIEKYNTPATLINTKWKDAFTKKYFIATDQISLQPFEYRIVKN